MCVREDGERCLGALPGTGGHSGTAVDNAEHVNRTGTIENPTERAGFPFGPGVCRSLRTSPNPSHPDATQAVVLLPSVIRYAHNGEGGIRTRPLSFMLKNAGFDRKSNVKKRLRDTIRYDSYTIRYYSCLQK